jgi:hypothetical protein
MDERLVGRGIERMPMKKWHGTLGVSGVLLGVALACGLGGRNTTTVRAADDDKPRKAAPAGKFYYGAKRNTCGLAGCHSSPPDSEEMYVCLCTEFTTWEKKDKHAKAFEVLKSDRSKRMGKLLWGNEDVTSRPECLSCHAVVTTRAEVDKRSFQLEQGVTCVVCHGAAKEWVDFHQVFGNRDTWRVYTPADKAKLGLNDLGSPHARAELCASCHVGSIKPGEPDKFVTHDMYAAGHPPLPSFETATFSDQMPRHWRYRQEKRQDLTTRFPGKGEEVTRLLRHSGEGEERTRLALVSAAVVLRQNMLLLVRQAERCTGANASQAALDMANFDCYACHHDLKSPSWRQKRGYAGKPGRPQLPPWPLTLMKLAIREAAEGEPQAKELRRQFEEKLRQVQGAIEDRPYGNPEKLVPAASGLGQWAEQLAMRLEKKKIDASVARRILHEIPLFFEKELLDYHSARQVAWTFQIIQQELGDPDSRVQEILARQDKLLRLRLPSGQDRNIVRELKSGLEILNSYEPDPFRKALQELSRCLEGKPRRDDAP